MPSRRRLSAPVPSWVMPGAFADFDFRNLRSYGAPVNWNAGANPGQSAVMQGSGLTACYLPGADGVFRLKGANTIKIADGVGLANFQSASFQAAWNRDLTNAVWTKTGCTASRSNGADSGTNTGSRLTATAANATCSQSITLASITMLLSAVIKRVSGSGSVSLSVDGGASFTALSLTTSFQQLAIPQQTLANPQVVIQIATSGDVIDIDFVDLETGTSAGATCPTVPGPPLLVSGTIPLARFVELPEINNGRSGGGYPNGALGDRWLNALNSGQAAIYAEFMGNPRSLAGFVAQTDGVAAALGNINPGSPVQTAAGLTSNVMLPGWNRAMSGFAGAPTAGGGGATQARGCLNGGPLVSSSSTSPAALNATHMVIGGQGSGVASLDGYIGRVALFDRLPPDWLFIERTRLTP